MGVRRLVLIAMLALGSASVAAAQDEVPPDPFAVPVSSDTTFGVDQIVAVVGTEPILESEVAEQYYTVLNSGRVQLPTANDSARLRHAILDTLVKHELLEQEAIRDTSIKVTPDEVSQATEANLRQIRSLFRTEQEFQVEITKSGFKNLEEFRRMLAERQRKRLLRERLIEHLRSKQVIKPISPTEAEMRAYFDAEKGQLGERPATVTFRQLVLAPQPSPAAKAQARALADSIALSLRTGGDFATAARRFSEDSASASQGGDLGWQRRGTFVRQFDEVVFRLKPGVVSDPVETVYGYHVIQVQRVTPTEVNARHILIVPTVVPENVDSARALAARLAVALRAGARMDTLQARYHDEAEEREASDIPLERLPPAYQEAIASAPDSTVVGPFELPGPGGKVKFAILSLTDRRPAGQLTYEDVREQIRRGMSFLLGEQQYLDRLRRRTYVEIRQPLS